MSTGKVFGNATPEILWAEQNPQWLWKPLPIRLGNMASLSMFPWTQAIRCSIYSGAGIFVGRLKFSGSCHKYSNLRKFKKKPSETCRSLGGDLLVSRFHFWTRLGWAELGDRAVEKVDLVVKVDHCQAGMSVYGLGRRMEEFIWRTIDRKPFTEVLPFR